MKAKIAKPGRSEPFPPLTFRDEDILKAVETYHFLTARDITSLFFSRNSITHARERLAALAGGADGKEGAYLYRFTVPSRTGSRERVYTLGSAGREALVSMGVPVTGYFRPYKAERLSFSFLTHQLTLTRFMVAAALWGRNHPDYTLAEMRLCYEIEKRMSTLSGEKERSSALVIPDGWLLFERAADRARSPLLIEIDRGSEYQERFKNHVRARLAFIHSGDYAKVFGIPAVMIAYVTTGQIPAYRETRVKTMAAWTREVLAELKMERWAGIFRFTSAVYETLYEDAQTLFEKPVWYRPDEHSTPVPLLSS
jgi:protein involved in plasmid replication-relaxation